MQENKRTKPINNKKNYMNKLAFASSLTLLSIGTGLRLSTPLVKAAQSSDSSSISQIKNSINTTSSTTLSQNASSSTANSEADSSSSASSSSVVSSEDNSSSSATSASVVSSEPDSSSSVTSSSVVNSEADSSSSATSSSVVSSEADSSSSATSSSAVNSEADSSSSDISGSNSSTTNSSAALSETNSSATSSLQQPTLTTTYSATVTTLLRSADNISIGDTNYTKADTVDISSYQSWLTLSDFQQLKALGIKSVIVKITEGTGYINPYAASQISLAEQAGLNIAVYHYATFSDSQSGYSQGQYAATEMTSLGLNKNTLIFADMEDSKTLSNSIEDGLNAFWNALSSVGYNNHGVYTYDSYKYRDQVVATVGTARTWIAQYPYTPSNGGYYETKWQQAGYGGWQFSSTAYLNGKRLDVSHDYNGLLTKFSVPSDNFSNIDNFTVNGNQVTVSGWHVAFNSTTETNAYIIMYDSTSGKEIARIKYTPTQRNDVANVYGYVPNAAYSGFNVTFTIPSNYNISGKNVQFVMRYSDDSAGNGNYTDVWSQTYTMPNANAANIDSFSLSDNNVLHVSGWHAADASLALKYAYLIVFDDTTGKEITRVAYTPTSRPDVAKNGYGYIANAANSGFNQDIYLGTSLVAGHKLQIVMRYSNMASGEGTEIDSWSQTYTLPNANAANIDSFSLSDNNVLHVSGWHAADASSALKYAYLIVFDDTTGKEITRVAYTPTSRPDVAKNGYADVANAANSGFSQDINLGTSLVAGHKLQIVMRYSDDSAGNGNNIDAWSQTYTLPNANAANIDIFSLSDNNVLHVSGWHAADASSALKYAYLIVFDDTTGKEITRVAYTPTSRPDVAKNGYGYIANAANSGFSQDINLGTSLVAGHKLQIVMRYSNMASGEGTKIDYWSDKIYYI